MQLQHKYTPLKIRCKDVSKCKYMCLDCMNLDECFKHSIIVKE